MLERQAYMWLNHIKTFRYGDVRKLFELFGSAKDIYENIYDDEQVLCKLKESGIIKESTLEELLNDDSERWMEELENRLVRSSMKVVTPVDEDYPHRLLDIDDRPLAIYYRGNIAFSEDEHILAVIGSRRVSDYGMMAADEFTKELSRKGLTIISGMAYGVDGKAHSVTIRNGGKTIAVLGGGVDICYPRTNLGIYMEMCEKHLVLSEYEPGEKHIPIHFPRRNRIISGMSDGLLVVEAALQSGTLITVKSALEQGKNIYAIPGRTTDIMSKGTNSLIKQGAMLVDSPSDIIIDMLGADYRYHNKKGRSGHISGLSDKEKHILGQLGYEPVFVEDLIRNNAMDISGTIEILRSLEEKGYILSIEQSYYVLNKNSCL